MLLGDGLWLLYALGAQLVVDLTIVLRGAFYFAFAGSDVGNMTGVEFDGAESVDEYELYSFVRYSLILDGIAVKDGLDFLSLIWEADGVDFFVSAFNVFSDGLYVLHAVIGLILKIF